MKRTILFLALAIAALAASAQDNVCMRFVYEYKYLRDSTTNLRNEDLMNLIVSCDKSLFYSVYTFESDSLRKQPDSKAKFNQAFSAAIAKDGAKATSFPYRRTSCYLYKDFKDNRITVYDNINEEQYVYEDRLDAQDWTLNEDSIRTVLDYDCMMATCHYHGRNWIAWFTTDIPLSNGPWKLGGLPGLILEAYDEGDDHHFQIKGVEKCTEKAFFDKKKDGKYKKTKRAAFLQAKRNYLERQTFSFELDNMVGLGADKNVLKYDFIETDYNMRTNYR